MMKFHNSKRYYRSLFSSLSLSSLSSSLLLSSPILSSPSQIINKKCYSQFYSHYNNLNHINNHLNYTSNSNRNSDSNRCYHTTITCYDDHDHDHDHDHNENSIKLKWIKRNGKEEITYAKVTLLFSISSLSPSCNLYLCI